MLKIFISCPFNKYIKDNVFIDKRIRKFTEDLYNTCLEYANEVFLALKREDYGAKPLLSYSCTMDLDEMANSDLIIAIPEDSMGVAVELGWATMLTKEIIFVLDKSCYDPYILDINTITKGAVVWYDSDISSALSEIASQIQEFVNSKSIVNEVR